MTLPYIYDEGIKPWEWLEIIDDSDYATITIIQPTVTDLVESWSLFSGYIKKILNRTLKWRTIGYPLKGSKVQELKVLKQLKGELDSNHELKENLKSGVYSYVLEYEKPLFELDLNTISQANYTLLIFTADLALPLPYVWDVLKDADLGLDAKKLHAYFKAIDSSLVCRVFEDDTHAVLQFIGQINIVDRLLVPLSKLKADRVKQKDVANIINNFNRM